MKRSEILDTAKSHVTKDRNRTHGEPEDSFRSIAELWNAYLVVKANSPDVDPLNIVLNSVDIGNMMALFKLARAMANPLHEDNWADFAGYVACAGELASQSTCSESESK